MEHFNLLKVNGSCTEGVVHKGLEEYGMSTSKKGVSYAHCTLPAMLYF